MADFEPVIGLEVHAQLLTKTKIFCGCPTTFGAPPNTHVCPVCLGLPGALPALNRAVVEMAVKAGKAFGCTIARRSVWARKNYFYPDLPKGYQISQYEIPICAGGFVTVPGLGKVGLERIHLEEDAGKNVHAEGGSEVDLNRSGVPLIEIVGKPELRSSEDASEYLKALRLALIYLGINDGNLEEGSFRCDANVSVRPRGEAKLGTRVELKNINSFRFVRQAIDHEIARQIEAIGNGERIRQETRLFDHQRGETRPMRSKEEANDYRYFPEPDLPPLALSQEWIESVEVPRLPQQVSEELAAFGLSAVDVQTLTADKRLADLYFEILGAMSDDDRKWPANVLIGEIARAMNEQEIDLDHRKFTAAQIANVYHLQKTKITSTAARQILAELIRTGRDPEQIVAERGLAQETDLAVYAAVVEAVMARSPGEAEKYRGGKKNLLGFFVGQAMKELKGKGNPAVLTGLFKAKLGD